MASKKIRTGDTVRFIQPVIEGKVIAASVNEDSELFYTVEIPDPDDTDGDGDGVRHVVLSADVLEKVEPSTDTTNA